MNSTQVAVDLASGDGSVASPSEATPTSGCCSPTARAPRCSLPAGPRSPIPSSAGPCASSSAADTTKPPSRSRTDSLASPGASGAISAPSNVYPSPAIPAEEVVTNQLHRDIEDGSRSDRRRDEPITVLAPGVEQSIGTLRDFPSWPGRSRRPPSGPKIRLQSTSALLAISPPCPNRGRSPDTLLGRAPGWF